MYFLLRCSKKESHTRSYRGDESYVLGSDFASATAEIVKILSFSKGKDALGRDANIPVLEEPVVIKIEDYSTNGWVRSQAGLEILLQVEGGEIALLGGDFYWANDNGVARAVIQNKNSLTLEDFFKEGDIPGIVSAILV